MSEQNPNLRPEIPREKVERMQAEFDLELNMILEEIEVWNFRIATAFEEDRATGSETFTELAISAKNELDEMWSYYGDWLVVSGLWDVNNPKLSERGVMNDYSEDVPVFAHALSNGFEIDVRDDLPPEIGFSFKIGQTVLLNKFLYGTIDSLAFARPNRASFSFARKSAEFETSKEPLVDAVQYYDGLLKLYTHEPSDFYRKSPKLQQQFFNNLVDNLTDIITVPSHATVCNYAEVPYVYRRTAKPTPDGNGLQLEYIETPGQDIVLSGIVNGVVVLESLYATDTPLKSVDDLIDPDAGICFIMTPSEGSLRDNDIDDRDFLVPCRLIKELDLYIK